MSRLSFKQFALLPALLLAFGTFITAQEYSYNYKSTDFSDRNPCKPFIGVGTSKVPEGLKVDYTVNNTPATIYDVRAGDVILTLDGVPVHSQPELLRERDKHQQGEAFTLVILRDGVEKTIQARFKACSAEELEDSKQNMESALAEKEIRLEEMQALLLESFKGIEMVERDPCEVFIGVYTSSHALDGRGARVDGVIDDTPAKQSGIQPGDIILTYNGQSVNSHQELIAARNKNKAGDAFQLTVLREGITLKIDARYKACDQNAPKEETAEVLEEKSQTEQREAPTTLDNTLKLEVFEAYPSPTYGTLNIQFEAEAIPTTVRILDVSGRAVYQKSLPKFDGSFAEQVNLSNNKAGNYVLSIQQGEKVQSKQIVLLPRA